jgi:hypothetical protein
MPQIVNSHPLDALNRPGKVTITRASASLTCKNTLGWLGIKAPNA